jgi:Protein of unknown function (DUF2997)
MWRPLRPHSSIHRKKNMIDHITGKTTFTQIVEVIVSPNGETKIETKGFTGTSCRHASRFLEEALGQRVGEQLTAEFHATSTSIPLHQSQNP